MSHRADPAAFTSRSDHDRHCRSARPELLSHQLRWIAVLTVGAALYAAVLAALLGTGDILYVPSLLLLGAAIVPVTFVTFVGLQGRGLSVGRSPRRPCWAAYSPS